jgi:hypothetical protein
MCLSKYILNYEQNFSFYFIFLSWLFDIQINCNRIIEGFLYFEPTLGNQINIPEILLSTQNLFPPLRIPSQCMTCVQRCFRQGITIFSIFWVDSAHSVSRKTSQSRQKNDTAVLKMACQTLHFVTTSTLIPSYRSRTRLFSKHTPWQRLCLVVTVILLEGSLHWFCLLHWCESSLWDLLYYCVTDRSTNLWLP